MLDVKDITTTAPSFYAILPFTPIIGVLIFDGKWGPELHIITILVICMLLAAVLEFFRGFNTQNVFSGTEVAYRGMADAFAGVVMLLVAAGVFAQGLSTIGFIQSLISIATSFGSASIILMLVLVILTMLAAMTTGSGNAPFYAFVEMIPKLAHESGINPAYLSIPMLQASNLGRTISPVSGVVVAVAGMANISPFEVVKRTSVPVIVGLIVVIIGNRDHGSRRCRALTLCPAITQKAPSGAFCALITYGNYLNTIIRIRNVQKGTRRQSGCRHGDAVAHPRPRCPTRAQTVR